MELSRAGSLRRRGRGKKERARPLLAGFYSSVFRCLPVQRGKKKEEKKKRKRWGRFKKRAAKEKGEGKRGRIRRPSASVLR